MRIFLTLSKVCSKINDRFKQLAWADRSGIFLFTLAISFAIYSIWPGPILAGTPPHPPAYLSTRQLKIKLSGSGQDLESSLLEIKINGAVVDREKLKSSGSCPPQNGISDCYLSLGTPSSEELITFDLLVQEGPQQGSLLIAMDDQPPAIFDLTGASQGVRSIRFLLPPKGTVTAESIYPLLSYLVSILVVIAMLAAILFTGIFTALPLHIVKGSGDRFALLGVMILIVYVNTMIISAGKIWEWPEYRSYYALQADSFRRLQTALPLEPDPRLLALPDPYDRTLNRNFREHDLSLFNGKYYLYWSPVPAAILVPLQLIGPVKDQHLVFLFEIGSLIIAVIVMSKLHYQLYPSIPNWTVLLPTLALGLGTPVGWILGRPAVYEASISGGQFFMTAGLLLVFLVFFQPGSKTRFLLGAGACWGLAIGSRLSLAGPVAFHIAWVTGSMVFFFEAKRNWRSAIRPLLLMAAPVALMGMMLLAYNAARFGSIFETGWKYQLNSDKVQAVISRAYILPNLLSYFFRPVLFENHFPFIYAVDGFTTGAFPEVVKLPVTYAGIEKMAGLLWTAPFLLFSIPAALCAFALLLRSLNHRKKGIAYHRPTPTEYSKIWSVIYLSGSTLIPLVFLMAFYGAATRYLADFITPAYLLAAVGLWETNQRLKETPFAKILLIVVTSLLTVGSIVVSINLGAVNQFRSNNPALYLTMANWGDYFYYFFSGLLK